MKANAAILIGPLVLLTSLCASAHTDERVEKHFDVAAGGRLVVDVDFGNVEVSAGAANQVQIEARRELDLGDEASERDFLQDAPITITQGGNTVTIRAKRHRREWSWHGSMHMDGKYTVKVPANFDADLHTGGGSVVANELVGTVKADTSGGKLNFSKLRGALNGRTSGGNVEVSGCEGPLNVATSGGGIQAAGGSGRIDAHTSGGSIVVQDFSGDTNVETSGGRLTLLNINGQISGRTSGGSVRATLAAPVPGDVHLETSAGSIDVVVPTNAGLTVDAQASAGHVVTDLPFTGERSNRESLRGTLNGGGKSLRLRSGAGSIHIHGSGSSGTDETT